MKWNNENKKKMENQYAQIIKHIAHRVEIEILNHKCDYVGIKKAKSNGFYYIGKDLYITYEGGSVGKLIEKECKLALIDLSFLTKNIEINGKKFIPIIELTKVANPWLKECDFDKMRIVDDSKNGWTAVYFEKHESEGIGLVIELYDMLNLSYKLIEKLLEWHFDVFRLMPDN